MIQVTEYTPQGRGKIKVCLDNGSEFLLYRREAEEAGLAPGGMLSEEAYTRLLEETLSKRALRRALHLLERMDRTEKELRDKLAAGGYPQPCIDYAAAYVCRYHYLDDYRYACGYIRGKKERFGPRQLMQKLVQKGVDKELALRALEEEYTSDESEQICSLLTKRHFVSPCSKKEFVKTYQYLMRRGFTGPIVLKVMRSYCSDAAPACSVFVP